MYGQSLTRALARCSIIRQANDWAVSVDRRPGKDVRAAEAMPVSYVAPRRASRTPTPSSSADARHRQRAPDPILLHARPTPHYSRGGCGRTRSRSTATSSWWTATSRGAGPKSAPSGWRTGKVDTAVAGGDSPGSRSRCSFPRPLSLPLRPAVVYTDAPGTSTRPPEGSPQLGDGDRQPGPAGVRVRSGGRRGHGHAGDGHGQPRHRVGRAGAPAQERPRRSEI